MLTVYTSAFARPDYVQLIADAIAVTCREPYRFVVVLQPGGLRREWSGVHEVRDGARLGPGAFREIHPMIDGPSVIMHDDLVPVLPWDSSSFPAPHCSRKQIGTTLYYHAGAVQPALQSIPVTRVSEEQDCPPSWSEPLCAAAAAANVESLADGVWLHLDKGTVASPLSPASAEKPRLVEEVCRFLGIGVPAPLTPTELAAHPGRMYPARIEVNRRPAAAQPPAEEAPAGLGDMVSSALSAVGITKERVSKILGKPCGCGKRAEAMNKFGAKYLGLPPGRVGNLGSDT